MNEFRELPTKAINDISIIQRPLARAEIRFDDPASEVFTDFEKQMPLMLEQSTTVDEARELMKKSHEKLKLVIDSQESFRGIISLSDLLSHKVMSATEKTGLPRRDLSVAHVMTPRSVLHAIDTSDFANARVGDVLATMKKYGDQHVLVVDMQQRCIRGIVSADEIARRMRIPNDISERANSFSDIYTAVRG